MRSSSLTFLDDLPTEAVEHLVRRLSAKPRRSAWSESIESADVASLLACPGSIGSISRVMFRALVVGAMPSRFNTLNSASVHVHCAATPSVAIDLAASANIEHLALMKTGAFARELAWMSFMASAPALHRLSVHRSHLAALLPAVGPRLRELDVPKLTDVDIPLVASHCTQLSEMTTLYSPVDLTPVWRASGWMLQVAHFSVGHATASASLTGLAEHCRSLQSIVIGGRIDFSPHLGRLGALCSSLGPSLRSATLPSAVSSDETVCRSIASACTNARLRLRDGELSTRGMAELGPLVDEAALTVLGPLEARTHVSSLRLCSNIRRLDVFCSPYATVPDLTGLVVDLTNSSLEELRVCMPKPIDADRLFEGLSKRIGGLRRFVYSGYTPGEGSFTRFAKANAYLTHIDISFYGTGTEENQRVAREGDADAVGTGPEAKRMEEKDKVPECSKDSLESYLSVLRTLSRLEDVLVRAFPGLSSSKRVQHVANACNIFRHRKVSVHICGHDYLA